LVIHATYFSWDTISTYFDLLDPEGEG